jgi:hypothetical protein
MELLLALLGLFTSNGVLLGDGILLGDGVRANTDEGNGFDPHG